MPCLVCRPTSKRGGWPLAQFRPNPFIHAHNNTHKHHTTNNQVFVAAFAKAYPQAQVYACVGQWAWPINLPPPFRVDSYIASDDQPLPWANEIEHAVLRPPTIGIGPANEVVCPRALD